VATCPECGEDHAEETGVTMAKSFGRFVLDCKAAHVSPGALTLFVCSAVGMIVRETAQAPLVPGIIKECIRALLRGAGADSDEVEMIEVKGGGHGGN